MVPSVQQRLAIFYNIGFATIYLRYKLHKVVFRCQILDSCVHFGDYHKIKKVPDKIVGVARKLPEIIKNLLYNQDNTVLYPAHQNLIFLALYAVDVICVNAVV
jgi:hypothetical protein